MRGFGFELKGESSSCRSHGDILSANIVGWPVGCLLSLGHLSWSLRAIAKQVGCGHAGIDVMLRGQARQARPVTWVPRPGALSIAEREEILCGLSRGDSLSAIARQLHRFPSTVSREVGANGDREHYRVWPAHCRTRELSKRPKTKKLSYAPLAMRVRADLERLWSPEEIARRLAIAFLEEPRMQLSPKTIDQSLYVQGKGELRRELTRCLRCGHATRHPQGSHKKSGPIANMVMISDRPAEVQDRAVPGHPGGRSHHRRPRCQSDRHPRRAHDPLCPAPALARVATAPTRSRLRCAKRSRPCRSHSPRPSRGIREANSLDTWSSPSRPASRFSHSIPISHGNEDRTRTPMDFFVNTCQRAPISPSTRAQI